MTEWDDDDRPLGVASLAFLGMLTGAIWVVFKPIQIVAALISNTQRDRHSADEGEDFGAVEGGINEYHRERQ